MHYTLFGNHLQLTINLNTQIVVKDDGKVQLVRNLIERMNLKQFVNVYANKGRSFAVDPLTMFQILLFCYSEGTYSARNIEKMCKYDVRCHYLL